jgi:hypothetical protein
MTNPDASAELVGSGALVPTGNLALAYASCSPCDEETPDAQTAAGLEDAAAAEATEDPHSASDADRATTAPGGASDQAPQAQVDDTGVLEPAMDAPASGFELAPAFRGIAMRADELARWQTSALGINTSWIRLPSLVANFTAAAMPKPIIAEHILPAARVDLGFHNVITKMAASWHLGLLNQERQLATSVAGMVAAHDKALRSAVSAISASYTANFTRSLNLNLTPLWGDVHRLSGLFRQWREVADIGFGLIRRLAQAALAAALRARTAVLYGQDEPVADFIARWLGLRVTPERIEAVSAALLEEGWDTNVVNSPEQLLSDLKKRTRRQARVLRPIWETQLNNRPIGLLDQPSVTRTVTLSTPADLVRDPQSTEDLALCDMWEQQQRLRHVLDRLKPDERDVTNLYAQHPQLTWADAARAAGAADPAAMGERVRRKLRRLGEEDKRRLTLQLNGT